MSKQVFEMEFGYSQDDFNRKVEEIETAGGIAFVEKEYGRNMSGAEEYMGLRLYFITADSLRERLAEAEREALLKEWCPVCKEYHKPPLGVKTDAGKLVEPCPLLPSDHPRNDKDNYPGNDC